MASTTTYYDQSSDYNWLDAILKNKSFCDPRTFEVHQCFVTTQVPRKSSSRPRTFNREVLVHTPPENRTRSVSEWVADSAPSWREEKPEQAPSINSTDNEDVASITSSTVCSSPDEDIPTFSQLEAFPPYPKQRAGNSLFELRNQICRPGGPVDVFNLETSPILVDNDSISPQLPSMTLSSSNTTSSLKNEGCTTKIGKLVAGKIRQAAALGAKTCQKMKRKLTL